MPYYTDVKCLIFTNPTANASIDTMTLDMAAAMRQLGINARVFLTSGETMNMEFVGVLLREIQMHTGRSFIVDVNGRYDIGTGDSNFFDQMGVPKFSFMTDNPSALTPKLRGIPKNFLCGMVQNEHLEHCEAYGLDASRAIFFPHGGPVPLANQRPSAERDIDILFAGNVQTVPDFKTWLKARFPKSDQLREALQGIEQRLYATDTQPFSTVLDALKAAGIEITPALLAQMYTPLERFLINRERARVLSAIQKHSLTVIGEVSKEIIEANPQHKFLGPRTYGDVMDAMARAKVSLNIVPTFRSGGHERMFYSLAAGALLVTDKNEYLQDDETSNPFVNFLPDDLGKLDAMLEFWLDDDGVLDKTRAEAVAHYAQRHTWVQRLEPVLEFLNEHYWTHKTP